MIEYLTMLIPNIFFLFFLVTWPKEIACDDSLKKKNLKKSPSCIRSLENWLLISTYSHLAHQTRSCWIKRENLHKNEVRLVFCIHIVKISALVVFKAIIFLGELKRETSIVLKLKHIFLFLLYDGKSDLCPGHSKFW